MTYIEKHQTEEVTSADSTGSDSPRSPTTTKVSKDAAPFVPATVFFTSLMHREASEMPQPRKGVRTKLSAKAAAFVPCSAALVVS